ncbi:MAG: type II toxin-antitoxin system Phd/YefM family antitoxin [Tabrizicola sp.]|jgi:prevent-host-death family protein|uniref:type II toxin-antitoxin system Phd/YefM family antitoxin n=1 Tax=Tabrizicola sp. TaxID=2005166 RepID=UPI001B63CD28|nr:type II toxin-antitoxin system Phd/YefM family antitoxin [Tabrizicola sp.]MCC6518752.1 type II toxin-antitoxin system Phd/YefM family antitoxin [Tabrizicola sp.]
MWSLQDAKNRFSAVVEAALAGRPQEVTRRGRPAVVVLAVEEYERLVQVAAGRRESFAEHLLHFPGAEVERLQAKPRDVAF